MKNSKEFVIGSIRSRWWGRTTLRESRDNLLSLLLLGDPGVGKSVLLNQLFEQIIEDPNCALIRFDLKGSSSDGQRWIHECAQNSKKRSYFVTSQSGASHLLSLLDQLGNTSESKTQLAERLVDCFDIGSANTSYFRFRCIKAVVSAFEQFPGKIRTLHDLIRVLEREDFVMPGHKEDYAALIDAITGILDIPAFAKSALDTRIPKAVRDNAVDFRRVVRDSEIVDIRLTSHQSVATPLLDTALTAALLENENKSSSERKQVVIVLDDAADVVVAARNVISKCKNIGRDFGVVIIVALQNFGTCKRGDPSGGLIDELMAYPTILFSVNDGFQTYKRYSQELNREVWLWEEHPGIIFSEKIAVSYRQEPEVPLALWNELLKREGGVKRQFLFRCPGSRHSYYRWGQAEFCFSENTFEQYRAAGFLKASELTGTLENPKFDFEKFAQQKKLQPNSKSKKKQSKAAGLSNLRKAKK